MTPVRTHDFHRADTLDRQYLRTLNAALDAFARHGSVGLSSSLRRTSQLTFAELSERPWREITEVLDERPYLATFNLDPFGGTAIMSFSLETANRVLEFRLGGGNKMDVAEHPNLTDTDFAILESTITPLLGEFAASLSRVISVTPTLVAQESSTQFMQFAAASEMFLVATFELTIAEDDPVGFTLALAFGLVRKLFEAAQAKRDRRENPALLVDENAVLSTPINLWLELPPIRLASTEVSAIAVGDVIRFSHPLSEPLDLRAEGVLIARAARGAIGSKLVCSVLEEVTT